MAGRGCFASAAAGALVYLLALGLTQGALDLPHALNPDPSRELEAGSLLVASAFATISRYVALRTWRFTRGRRGRAPLQAASLPD